MTETQVERMPDGRLVLRPSRRALERRAARARLEAADAAQVRERAALEELRSLLADVIEALQGGGENRE